MGHGVPELSFQPKVLQKRYFRLCAVLFLALFLACSIAKDVRTPMWTDELLTLYMSEQPSAAEMVKATLEGRSAERRHSTP